MFRRLAAMAHRKKRLDKIRNLVCAVGVDRVSIAAGRAKDFSNLLSSTKFYHNREKETTQKRSFHHVCLRLPGKRDF